jgi:uncharacterized membrane protein YeiB
MPEDNSSNTGNSDDGRRDDLSAPLALGPVTGPERIGSLDVLRGFAILGILVINIPMFSLSSSAWFDPTIAGGFEGANYWVWKISFLFFQGKFLAIFAMLFGAGVILLTDRIESKGRSARKSFSPMPLSDMSSIFSEGFRPGG